MKTEHTPLPWKRFNLTDIFPDDDDTYGTKHIADCQPDNPNNRMEIHEQDANAEFIIRACNSYYDLLEACKRARATCSPASQQLCDAAIVKAEKG